MQAAGICPAGNKSASVGSAQVADIDQWRAGSITRFEWNGIYFLLLFATTCITG